ncbi:MAG: NADH-ubiquinone oxidoreductase subunit NDUFA12 family protein, partial [Pseudomonadota bacterium]|nr:NADH-ubiquinone oxidoreductase subunit NDUFA12 family protein [Pseudomonadota bacterium]
MTIGTRIFTWLNGKLVGSDRFGNRYYVNKGGDGARGRQKRWVVYKGQ